MEISGDLVIERAEDASRLREKNSVFRLDCTSTGNNKGSSYEDPSKLVLLLPPFMQIKRQKCSPVEKSFTHVSRETADRDVTRHTYLRRAKKIASLENGAAVLPYPNFEKGATSVKKNSTLSRSEKVVIKSDVSREDTKITSEAICEALQGTERHETECLAEMGEQRSYLEPRDSDHREWSEDFQKDGTDYQERRYAERDRAPWTLAHCKSRLLFSESDHGDQDPNTTDPLLAHELPVPYSRMSRPRLFRIRGKDAEYDITVLPGRPRSPVRHILPGTFDLRARTDELLMCQSIVRARKCLWDVKNRISRNVKQVSGADVDFDLIICELTLGALCEQIILTMTGISVGVDVRIFINVVVVWALVDLKILEKNKLDEQERIMFAKVQLLDSDDRPRSREAVEAVGTSKLRRALFEAHRPEFDPRVLTQLHRRLPWALVSPAHQRGAVRYYPNVRERIDERLPHMSVHMKSAYVPDLTCFHLREVPDKAYVAYKKKSKSLPVPRRNDDEQDDELLVQLVSFV